MTCVLKWCKNRSDRRKKHPGITFHRFSKENEVWRNDWIQIIRNFNAEKECIPNKYSVICSFHFKAKDLYTTKGGLRRVVTYAVPQKTATMTLPALEPIVLQQEEQPDEPNIFASQESTSITVPALEPMVLQKKEQPDEPNISNGSQERPSMTVTALEPIVFQQEEQPAEPNTTSSTKQERITAAEE